MFLIISGGSVSGIERAKILGECCYSCGQPFTVLTYFPDKFPSAWNVVKYKEKPTPDNILQQIPEEILKRVKFVISLHDVYIDLVGRINSALGLDGIKYDDSKRIKSKIDSIDWLCDGAVDFLKLRHFKDLTKVPADLTVFLKPEFGTGSEKVTEFHYSRHVGPIIVAQSNSTFGELIAQELWQGDSTIHYFHFYHDGFSLHHMLSTIMEVDNKLQFKSLRTCRTPAPCLDAWSFLSSLRGQFFTIQAFFDEASGKLIPFDINTRVSAALFESIHTVFPGFLVEAVTALASGRALNYSFERSNFKIEKYVGQSVPSNEVIVRAEIKDANDPTYGGVLTYATTTN